MSYAEVLVVVALLGALLLTALPSFILPNQVPVASVARRVAADLGLARRLAIAGRANYLVTFTPTAGPFTSYSVAPQGGSPGQDFPKTFQSGLTVTGTSSQITFLPSGAASAAVTITIAQGTATAQVQVTAATGFIQVTGP
jgi:Tfp pilus assembly protein FimT